MGGYKHDQGEYVRHARVTVEGGARGGWKRVAMTVIS